MAGNGRAVDKVVFWEFRAGRPENPQARTPALRSAAVLGCGFKPRLAAFIPSRGVFVTGPGGMAFSVVFSLTFLAYMLIFPREGKKHEGRQGQDHDGMRKEFGGQIGPDRGGGIPRPAFNH